MFQQPSLIDDVNTIASAAIDALDALPTDVLRGAERKRTLCERLVMNGEVVSEDFREAGAEILRYLVRIEPDETIVRELDRAMRRLRDAINGAYRTAVARGVEHASSIQRAA